MKVNFILTVLFVFLFNNVLYSQFPLGKNGKIAEQEIKQFLKSKGFTFLKKLDSDKDEIELAFSEEFMVFLSENEYENIVSINVNTLRYDIWNKLKTTFNFSNWKYIGEHPNVRNEIESFYEYKKFQIRIPPHEDKQPYQFIVSLKDDN